MNIQFIGIDSKRNLLEYDTLIESDCVPRVDESVDICGTTGQVDSIKHVYSIGQIDKIEVKVVISDFGWNEYQWRKIK